MRGKVFTALWKMESHCPVCNLEFEREPGYYLGAMYFSYGLGVISGLPIFILLLWLEASTIWILIILILQFTLSSPLLFRYSRVMWLHFDQLFDPR